MRKFGYFQNNIHFSGTLSKTLDLVDLDNFATARRSSQRVVNLARQKWTLSVTPVTFSVKRTISDRGL